MFRYISHLIISLLLIVSVLAPSVVTLFDTKTKTMMVVDFNDEENKKEGKKEVNEKDFLFYAAFEATHFQDPQKESFTSFFLRKYSCTITEILVPPPEIS
ncbi:MAG: hypothetical protein AAFZ89_00140 [Bacteroidota bacterium]